VQLDPMRHRDRLALRGQQHEQATGVESAEREQPAGDRVEAVELEDEPGICPRLGQGLAQLGAGGDHS